jgi:hypothetical protein
VPRGEPPRRADGAELGEFAQCWWLAWSQSPQAAVFTDDEWARLADTARLVDGLDGAEDPRKRIELLRELLRREEEELGWVGPAYRDREGS